MHMYITYIYTYITIYGALVVCVYWHNYHSINHYSVLNNIPLTVFYISTLQGIFKSSTYVNIFSCLSVFGLYAIYFVFLGLCVSPAVSAIPFSLSVPLCAYLFYSKINSRSKQAAHTRADKSSSWGCAAAGAVFAMWRICYCPTIGNSWEF